MDCCIKMSVICKSGITVSFASRQVCLARFCKPASLSCSLLQVCKLHGSCSCKIASCIALAVEQVCDLHRDRTCDTWRCFASVIAVAFASSRNHHDRFRNSREVLCVCSSEHTESSRSWFANPWDSSRSHQAIRGSNSNMVIAVAQAMVGGT